MFHYKMLCKAFFGKLCKLEISFPLDLAEAVGFKPSRLTAFTSAAKK